MPTPCPPEGGTGEGPFGRVPALHDRSSEGLPLGGALIIDPPLDSKVMTQETFRPPLPLVPYGAPDKAIALVNSGPSPLALYWFGADRKRLWHVLTCTRAGGTTVNGSIWHIAQPELPFGGLGASGQGSYHDRTGFERMSHLRSVFIQRQLSGTVLLRPPFKRMFDMTMKILHHTT